MRRLHGTVVAAALVLALGPTVAAAARKLYVTNSGGDDITVIDVESLKVLGSIHIGATVHGVCVAAKGDALFATVESDDTLRVIDTRTDRIERSLHLGHEPNQCAATPDGRYVAVPDYGGDRIEIVDAARLEVAATLGSLHPHNCYNAQDDATLFCSSMDLHAIYRIDLKTMSYTAEIPVSGEPRPFAVTRDRRRVYSQVSAFHGFVVAGIESNDAPRRIELPPAPLSGCVAEEGPATPSHGLALTPDDRTLWLTSLADGKVYEYDTSTLRPMAAIAVGPCPAWVTASADGRLIAVSNSASDDVSIIDARTSKELTRVKVGRQPKRLVFVN